MRPSSRAPQFWMFAGPNGSGKSTAYSRTETERSRTEFWIVNPDLLTAEIQQFERLSLDEANLEAVRRLESWLEATIRVHRSLGVETVLSTSKYQRIVTLAKSLGFEFRLVYVVLNSPELNVERVRNRVEHGGHDVPRDKIVDRYWRSLDQMPWFLAQADWAQVLDNSGSEVLVIGTKAEGVITLHEDTIPAVSAAMRAAAKL